MLTLTFKVPRDLAQRLEAASLRKRIPKSKFIRDVLQSALSKEKQEPSLHDLMKDSVGCFGSGKKDLATNPKYMKNFGKWRR